VHPNLRKQTKLKFSDPGQIDPVDVLFLALPHGQAQKRIADYTSLAGKIVDLSADFRLRKTRPITSIGMAPACCLGVV